jgi:hypothetical protein
MAPPRAPGHVLTLAPASLEGEQTPGPPADNSGPSAPSEGPPPSPPAPLDSRRACALAAAEVLRARGHTSGTLARVWKLTPRMVRKCLRGEKALSLEKVYDLPADTCNDVLTAIQARKRAA